MSSRLLADLNEAQREAVTHSEGPLLVLAGAGSGKTRVLTRRIAWLAEHGTSPERVLALTFSTKAAEEMRARAEELLDRPYEELWCSTFHAFCVRLLQDEAPAAGLDPFFHAVTPADRLALLLDRAAELSLERHATRGNAALLLASLIERVDRLKDELVSADDYLAWAQSLADAAEDAAASEQAEREIEFARFYADHDRMLSEAGALDFGEQIARAISMLERHAHVRERVAGRFDHVLVDEYQDTNFAQGQLLQLLVAGHRNVCVVGDDDQSIYRFRGASRKNVSDFLETFPDARLVKLEMNYRSPQAVLDAAHAVIADSEDRLPKTVRAAHPGGEGLPEVRFWRCENERAQAQAVAAEIEELVAGGADAGSIAVLLRSVRSEAQPLAAALEERSLPYRVVGAGAFFDRSEVRDVLAWLRLLLDPSDSSAVVRALLRPPIELSSVDVARTTQVARRRKIDMVSAVSVAMRTAGVPPDARERMDAFVRVYRRASRAFDEMRPDLFVGRLIERIGLRQQQLFVGERESLERLMNIARFSELAASWLRRKRGGTAREFATYLVAAADAGLREDEATPPVAGAVQLMTMHGAKGLEFDHVFALGLDASRMPGRRYSRREAEIPDQLLKESLPADTREAHIAEMRRLLYVAMTRARRRLVLAWPQTTASGVEQVTQKPSPFYEQARAALGAEDELRREELLGFEEDLLGAFRALRDDVLGGVAQVGHRMGEMRLDAHLDAADAVARYMELLKIAALIDRRGRQDLREAIAEVNGLLLEGASPQQRESFLASDLDARLVGAQHEGARRREAIARGSERSLESFIPMRGEGVVLSATDIEIYKSCPLRYKYARVYSIPREQTVQQRFGILVHQVLERFHSQLADEETVTAPGERETGSPDRLLTLFESGWQRSGFGETSEERLLHKMGADALNRYHERFRGQPSTPVWFERSFSFRIGKHLLRGRVDRVDRHPDGSFELIDYKTGKVKSPSQLKDDVQLSLYQIGARESWRLDASRQSYYYVLDDEQVPLEPTAEAIDQVQETAVSVAEGIRAQRFDPRPSWSACSICDFRLICPAAEK